MAALNETPAGSRLHIGIFGRTNSGKSALVNAITGQDVSIVSDTQGTTTDPVYKSMEIYPIGPCTIIDTAGFHDNSTLGKERIEKTKLAAEKTDVAVILFDDIDMEEEMKWYTFFREKKVPIICVISKCDIRDNAEELADIIKEKTGETPVFVSTCSIDNLKEAIIRCIPENYGVRSITGNLVGQGDMVLLVMPQDIQAPKGRLILPQVQTIRELLDKKCIVMSVTTDQYIDSLSRLVSPPKLIITDSQVFDYVYQHKPEESMLTSFSVLFAAYKGDIDYYIKGAEVIEGLTSDSRVLIAECCTHAPLEEDIGRVKLPRMLKKMAGENLTVDVVSGTDFPDDLSEYNLIIQCGGCMFNRTYIMSRIGRAQNQNIPMTNYGIAIAKIKGILDKVSLP
jgi:[FeFe] hydrogenase H-cluster maturation GTPase HydF